MKLKSFIFSVKECHILTYGIFVSCMKDDYDFAFPVVGEKKTSPIVTKKPIKKYCRVIEFMLSA